MARQQRIACLLAEDFEDVEFRAPYDALVRAGYEVDIIGAEEGATLEGKRGDEEVQVDRSIDDASPEAYDALFIPGGFSPDHLRADARFVRFTRDFHELRRPIATLCHGPQLLLSADVLDEHRLTAWKTVQDDLRHAGVDVVDEPVVRDGMLVTSRQPDDLGQFIPAMLELLEGAAVQGRGAASEVT
ncbi:MAG TPA: type 1 glutamine amidotransferase domain-containing protein [Myxococcaceae bacterium]|nr:type 1 glutamine amidotransferase domain-containing protein [Myxococcaceae bacterium]